MTGRSHQETGHMSVSHPSFAQAGTEEVPFSIEELFYSRTDARGVIVAGNAVFQRVSGFAWAQLIGAPHRIVRNPTTPRAVFRILWLTIEKKQPAVAYVCNLSADGRPYWVLATILPDGNSYLSVRVKPSSPLFATAKALYAEVAAAEEGGLTIEASRDLLLLRLREAGFASYAAFMHAALAQETTARNAALGHQISERDQVVVRLRDALRAVSSEQDALRTDFEGMRILPTNLRILASRIEPMGGPLSAIAGIYLSVSAEIFAQIEQFFMGQESLCLQMWDRFENAMFLGLCAGLQAEVAGGVADVTGSGVNLAAEALHLGKLSHSYQDMATTALRQAEQFAGAIASASSALRRSMLSLETVTVMGRVECARMGEAGLRIAANIDRLHGLNGQISGLLEKITSLTAMINSGLGRIRSLDEGDTAALHPLVA